MIDDSAILETGNWCTNCEFFESPEDMDVKFCGACGCADEDHVRAYVVREESV